MADNLEKSTDERSSGLLKALLLHPRETITSLARDRYASLGIRLFFLIGALAGVPLLIVIISGFLWIRTLLEEDFNTQLRWQLDNTRQSVELFSREKVSKLKFLISSYSYEQLKDSKTINQLLVTMKREFGDIVDLGLIDANGLQQAYAGPYNLLGKDYSKHEWFYETTLRGSYVSDVFLGYRKIPHFAISAMRESPERGTYWVLRATIDMETLNKFVAAIKLKDEDDAFIVNDAGVLQTPSRHHGNVLQVHSVQFTPVSQGVTLVSHPSAGSQATLGYVRVSESPWILCVVVKSTAFSRFVDALGRRAGVVYLVSALILIGIFLNYQTVKNVVSRIREADLKREEAIAQTEHSAKLASIGRLAAGIAHEINNPLAIINEKAGLMQDIIQITGDKPTQEKFSPLLKGITDSVTRCRTITQRLLGFARRMDVSIEEINLNETIEEVIGFLEREILYRGIRFDLAIGDQLPKIQSDKGQLQQVFLNILNNAIDAVEDGGYIKVSTSLKNDRLVQVSISDNGSGIPKDVIKHIFEPFYSTKEKGKGTGLGLSLSYGIIQRLGGSIEVQSAVNKGTTFTIMLPVSSE